MILTSVKRVIKSGFVSFWRNGFLSFASIVVLALSLMVFGTLIFFSALTTNYLTEIKDKVDINVYFSINADESDMLDLQKSINSLPEVASTTYISRQTVLDNFKARHANDTLTLQGLQEVGSNPFPAVLNIKAKDPTLYESISNFLEGDSALSSSGKTIVDSVNYNKNKMVIDRLTKIIKTIEKVGLGLTIVLVLVSVIISFNTIRLTIYTAKEEISVMKLVGASNMHIRGPFVVSGTMSGIFAGIVALVALYPIAFYSARVTTNFSDQFSLLAYYMTHFAQIFGIIIISGIVLGAVSSYLAVRRYLNV